MEYEAHMKEQRELGDEIRRKVLSNILGPDDFAYLNSEVIFGSANRRFASKLPYIAAFGYGLGVVMSDLLGVNEKATHEISTLTSLFNIGISLFDYLYDTRPDLFNDLGGIINEKSLISMCDDIDTCHRLLDECKTIAAVEPRLLSKMIISFFQRLHLLYDQSRKESAWKSILSSLLAAYRAEMATSTQRRTSTIDSLAVSRDKSTLPFLVVLHISRLSPAVTSGEPGGELMSFATNLGELFWLLDDLMDTIPDLDSNMNSILIQIQDRLQNKETLSPEYTTLVELLNGQHIECQINKICSRITSILDFLKCSGLSDESLKTHHAFITSYVRSWMK
jgi:hypothetical protein